MTGMSFGGQLPHLAASALGRFDRSHPEAESPKRSPFRRDRDRIVHASAFRRLAHKTQVFSYPEGDHYRTRLTHTIEVAQIARSVSRNLGLDTDLTEALALAHDLGHTPFGHTGEDALAACMAPYGGFEHNAQTLRIVSKLEQRYAAFDGLNLTHETLDGVIKHNGPILIHDGSDAYAGETVTMPFALKAFLDENPSIASAMELTHHASLEAQVAALSDDIAYTAHDIDDGVRAGLFALEDLLHIGLVREIMLSLDAEHPGLPPSRRMGEFTRRLITRLIDAFEQSIRSRLEAASITTARAVLTADEPIAVLPASVAEDLWLCKAFLFKAMYRHETIVELRDEADRVVRELFGHFMASPAKLPSDWQLASSTTVPNEVEHARQVCDFIAGMTDRFALSLHAQAFDDTPDLRYGAALSRQST
ncbi:MAG: deoxyguanosinetriphosphate triphosphohydrolase [Pseudomonadota bacterium]